MSWENTLGQGNEIVLCTVSEDGSPHANIVLSEGMTDGFILINDCQMQRSIQNLKRDKRVCLVAKNNGEYYRIVGEAEIYASGKYFELSLSKNTGDIPLKNIILVKIESVFDLDKGEKVF